MEMSWDWGTGDLGAAPTLGKYGLNRVIVILKTNALRGAKTLSSQMLAADLVRLSGRGRFGVSVYEGSVSYVPTVVEKPGVRKRF